MKLFFSENLFSYMRENFVYDFVFYFRKWEVKFISKLLYQKIIIYMFLWKWKWKHLIFLNEQCIKVYKILHIFSSLE